MRKLRKERVVIAIGILMIVVGLSFWIKNFVFSDDKKNVDNDLTQKDDSEEINNKDDVIEVDKIIEDDRISKEITKEELSSELFSTTASKVMFVAHPDDETLWGGTALYHEKYLVVCLTCGVVEHRVEEFRNVMKECGDDYVMLSYPDLVNGKKSDWQDVWSKVDKDVQNIISLKEWDLIVTHNPDGEYGHIHHKYTNKMVTAHANRDKLMYFGRFYWGEIPNSKELYYLTEEEFNYKTKTILPLYKSQYGAIKSLSNMIHYESWISYNDWYGE